MERSFNRVPRLSLFPSLGILSFPAADDGNTGLYLLVAVLSGPERVQMDNRHTYDTLSQAVNDLQKRGYTDDLTIGGHCLVERTRKLNLDPAEFEIDEFHRFEGDTNPSDESIVYAISSDKHKVKGVLVNAFGPDASSMTQELVAKLATH